MQKIRLRFNTKTEKYKLSELAASFFLAVFIICMALIITANSLWAYRNSAEELTGSEGSFEAELNYEILKDEFCRFGNRDFSGLTINLSGENTDRISSLKSYYDRAVVFAVISVAAFLFFFIKAAKRKRYQSFLYGALGGIFLTLLNMIRFFVSGNPVIKGVRDMVIHKDYSFFDSGDGFTDILPPNLALNTALFYIMAVLALAGVFVLIRLIIRFINRPHRF